MKFRLSSVFFFFFFFFFSSQIAAQRGNLFCVNSISDFVFLQKVHIVTAILVEMEESAQILAMVLNVTVSRDLQAEFVR